MAKYQNVKLSSGRINPFSLFVYTARKLDEFLAWVGGLSRCDLLSKKRGFCSLNSVLPYLIREISYYVYIMST